MRYEHKRELVNFVFPTSREETPELILDRLSAEGWELVCVVYVEQQTGIGVHPGGEYAYLRRPLEDKAAA